MSAPTSTPGKDPVAFDPNYEYNAPKFRDFLVPSPPDAEYESYFNSTQPSQLTPPGAASSSGVTPAIAAMSAAGTAAPAEVQKQINFDDAAEAPAARPAAAAAAAAAPAASAAALADALISAMPAIPPTPAKPVSEAQAALPPFKHTEPAAAAAPAAAASSSSAAAAAKASKTERKSVDGRGVNKAPLKKRRMSAAPAAASSGARTRSVSATRKAALPPVARGKSPAKPAAAAAPAAAPEPSTARGRSRSRTKSDAGAELSKALAGTKRKSAGGAELAAAAATPRARSRSSTRPAAAAAAAAITAGSSSARASSRRSLGAAAAAAAPAAAAVAEPATARGRARARASMGSAAAAATPRSGSASARSRSASREKSLDRSMSDRALTARSSTATPSRASSRTRTSLGASASSGKLTVAASPKLRTKSRTRGAHEKSTEDAEMEAIEKGRAELQKRRKLNEAAVAAVLSEVGSVLPVRSTKSLTEPQEFHFSTDERLGKKKAEPKATPKRTPAKAPLKASASVPAITVPAPFHFESDKRIKHTADDVKPFVPLAAGVESFLKAPREAQVPIVPGAAAGAGMSSSASVPTLTQPKEFQFRTDARHRDPKILSTAEREEQEMAALKPFKAAPLNDKIMQSNGELGVPKVKKPAATVPREFHFATAEKAAEHAAKEAERAAAAAAKPLAYLLQQHPEIVAEEEAMLKARKEAAEKAAEERVFSSLAPKPPTVPMSPNITKPNPKKRKTPSPPGKYQFKARDMPDATPFKPDYAQAKPATAPVPFALATDERGAAKEQKFIATLEKEAEEARRAREFKAQQIGEGVAPATAAAVAQKPLTEPKPFELESVRRAELHRQQLAKQLEDEMAKENAMFSSFKARDLPAEHAAPFVPKKSGAPLTELAPFQLASDVRSEQRTEFDASKADRQAKAAAAQALRAAEIAAAEAAAVKQLRASMVHKALPILAVDQPFTPAPAAVAPTVPMSPPLATKARAQSGLRASSSVASLAR